MQITLLNEEQTWGENALQIQKDFGTIVGLTDWAVDRGASCDISYKDREGNLAGCMATTSSDRDYFVRATTFSGTKSGNVSRNQSFAICPVIPAEEAKNLHLKNIQTLNLPNGKSVQICEYGSYPQSRVSSQTSRKLEQLLTQNLLPQTGKVYTFEHENDRKDKAAEYLYEGKKYVRADNRWYKVEPVQWLMDESGLLRSKMAIMSGIRFSTYDKHFHYKGDFARTNMYNYLNTYFAKEFENVAEFVETKSRLAIYNKYFSNYMSGTVNKTFHPEGKNGDKFTPAKAKEIINITNAPPFMRDLLKLIASCPKEEQKDYKSIVLEIFNEQRHSKAQPNEVIILGKKLAVSGGYEEELNNALGDKTAQPSLNLPFSFLQRAYNRF